MMLAQIEMVRSRAVHSIAERSGEDVSFGVFTILPDCFGLLVLSDCFMFQLDGV